MILNMESYMRFQNQKILLIVMLGSNMWKGVGQPAIAHLQKLIII